LDFPHFPGQASSLQDDSASQCGIKPPSVESRDMEKSGGEPGPLHLTGKSGAAARVYVLTK
ncbi:MAG TPA: hypothetical protein VGL95_14310, partial [Acetobacteraceae bacterium]